MVKKSTARAKTDEELADVGRLLLADKILGNAEQRRMPVPKIVHEEHVLPQEDIDRAHRRLPELLAVRAEVIRLREHARARRA